MHVQLLKVDELDLHVPPYTALYSSRLWKETKKEEPLRMTTSKGIHSVNVMCVVIGKLRISRSYGYFHHTTTSFKTICYLFV